MAFSLYDATVANYLQILGGVSGVLDRGLAHFREKSVDPETIVEARLAPDMLPFRFQIISVAQHSRGAIEGVQQGVFKPPAFKTPYDYAGLQGLLADTQKALSALTPEAVNGAVLQMVNHGVSTGALFLIVGYFYERTHTRDLSQYGGVARVAPAMSAVFLVVVLSSIGLPGTNGFIGEFLILVGTFASTAPLGNLGALPRGQVFSVIAATGVVLGAVYMLWMVQRVIFGPKRRAAEHGMTDLTLREWLTVVPLLAAILLIGLYPQPFLNASRVPAEELIQRVARPRAARPQGAELQRPADSGPAGAARVVGER